MVIGTDTILLLILFGYVNYCPEMLVDISIAYAILGFISFVVVAKFWEERGPRFWSLLCNFANIRMSLYWNCGFRSIEVSDFIPGFMLLEAETLGMFYQFQA